MADRFNYHSHCVYNLGYHIIWCPKYRRKLLQWGIDERLKILLVEKATKMGCSIEQMEVMPDLPKGILRCETNSGTRWIDIESIHCIGI